jgi:hypothetical protein
MRELVGFARGRVLAVVALNLLGVVLQWTVIGAVLIFVGELTGDAGAFQTPVLGGLELPVEASVGIVSAWGIVVLGLVLVAALSTYRAETIGFSTAQRYVDDSSQRLLRSTMTATTTPVDGSDFPTQRLQVALIRDQIMVLRALLVVQRSLRAILMVIVAGLVLALINPALTAVIALVAALFVVPYYFLNRRMVVAATTLEHRNLSARLSIARTVEHATSRQPSDEVRRVVLDAYAKDPAIDDRWSVLRDLMLSGQRTTALMSALIGTCLVAVVVVFSLLIASDTASWVAALTFIIGLNLASGAFVQLASFVTAANRFLPHVQDFIAYREMLGDTSTAPDVMTSLTSPLPNVHVSEPVLPASSSEVPLVAGIRVLCISPGPIDRLNLQSLLARLVEGADAEARRLRAGAFFCGDHTSLPGVPLRQLLGSRANDALTKLGLQDEIAALPQRKDTVLTPEIQERMTPLLRYTLAVVEGLEHEVVVLGWKSFAQLSAEDRARLIDYISSLPVIFLTSGVMRRQPREVTHTAVLTEHGIAGMGGAKWYQTVTASLPILRDRSSPTVKAGSGPALLDLEDV